MNSLRLILPWPPTVNTYWRRWNGRTLVSAEGRAYRNHVALAVRVLGADRGLAGRLEATIDLFPPDRRRRDIDTLNKALLDALQAGGVYRDDNQIVALHVYRRDITKGGRVEVAINEIEEEP